MLQRRGYKDENISFTQEDDHGKKPRFEVYDEHEPLSVFFVEHSKVSIQIFKAILSTSKYKHIIIVHAFPLTPDTVKSFKMNTYLLYFFESFTFDEMSYDPVEIVAPHWLVKEKPTLWMRLPIILSTDIIARYYLFKPGDVVAIKEGNFTTYRKCVQVS